MRAIAWLWVVRVGGGILPKSAIDLRPFDYKRKPFEINLNNSHQKKKSTKILQKNPFKIEQDQKKVHKKIEFTFSFTREIPFKIIRNKKKINPEVWSHNTH